MLHAWGLRLIGRSTTHQFMTELQQQDGLIATPCGMLCDINLASKADALVVRVSVVCIKPVASWVCMLQTVQMPQLVLEYIT